MIIAPSPICPASELLLLLLLEPVPTASIPLYTIGTKGLRCARHLTRPSTHSTPHTPQVAKKVAPRRKKVKEMELSMHQCQKELHSIERECQELQVEIEELSKTYATKSADLIDLQEKANQMARHLEAAAKLITGLGK